jgi:hypothetical protein
MAIDKFNFVSPGVQINEIDDSVIAPASPELGPVVIGRTTRGPLMQPVRVSSVAELETIFGPTSNGETTGLDVWRSDLPTAPTFATYAAKAFLRNSAPVTVIRLGGVDDPGVGYTGKPGWKAGVVHQLFVSGTSGYTLAANIYASSSLEVKLSGSTSEVSASGGGGAVTLTGGAVKLTIGAEAKTIKFGPSTDTSFIRGAFSTDPTAYSTNSYFVGETFEASLGTYTGAYLTSSTSLANFENDPSEAMTGWVVGDRADGGEANRLFRLHAVGDGAEFSKQYKVSIENVRASVNANYTQYGTFDVVIRPLRDSSTANVLERHSAVSLDPLADNYIAKVIGDTNRYWSFIDKNYVEEGSYPTRSRYIRVEMATSPSYKSDLPHGFTIPSQPTPALAGATHPTVPLKTADVKVTDAKFTRFGLLATATGSSDLVDILRSNNDTSYASTFSTRFVSGTTSYVYGTTYNTTDLVVGGKIAGFDLPFHGGFDGVDITSKEPLVNHSKLLNGTELTNPAYRAVKATIDMIADAEFIDYDIVTIPNLKNTDLVRELVNVCRSRGDSIAIVDLQGDYLFPFERVSGDATTAVKDEVIQTVTSLNLDNSYGAAYFPAVYAPNERTFLPASIAALGAYAGTERRAALWFAPAGFNRGGLSEGTSGVSVSKTSIVLNAASRDDLYAANINPIATFPGEGVVIFGQKTLQTTPSALDRVNVRRLVNYLKKEISRASARILFEPNVPDTWNKFKNVVNPFLNEVKALYGIEDAKVVLDETTTTADLVDRNIMYCKLYVKPTRAIEYIAIDFVVTNSGAAFSD